MFIYADTTTTTLYDWHTSSTTTTTTTTTTTVNPNDTTTTTTTDDGSGTTTTTTTVDPASTSTTTTTEPPSCEIVVVITDIAPIIDYETNYMEVIQDPNNNGWDLIIDYDFGINICDEYTVVEFIVYDKDGNYITTVHRIFGQTLDDEFCTGGGTYHDTYLLPCDDYPLTVVGGTGSGRYPEFEIVIISATIPEGEYFVYWSGTGGTIDEVLDAVTTVTMAREEAIYTMVSAPYKTLTITNGTGSGTLFKTGDVQQIVADTPPANRYFINWTGSGATIEDVNSPTTNVTIGTTNASYQANYGDYVLLTVNDGTID